MASFSDFLSVFVHGGPSISTAVNCVRLAGRLAGLIGSGRARKGPSPCTAVGSEVQDEDEGGSYSSEGDD